MYIHSKMREMGMSGGKKFRFWEANYFSQAACDTVVNMIQSTGGVMILYKKERWGDEQYKITCIEEE